MHPTLHGERPRISAQDEPYFYLACLVLLLKAVLGNISKAASRGYHHRKGLESEREKVEDVVCLCGNALPRGGRQGAWWTSLKLQDPWAVNLVLQLGWIG